MPILWDFGPKSRHQERERVEADYIDLRRQLPQMIPLYSLLLGTVKPVSSFIPAIDCMPDLVIVRIDRRLSDSELILVLLLPPGNT